MNETIQSMLQAAIETLSGTSDSPQIDAEILLSFSLKKPRTYLFAWPEKNITEEEKNTYKSLIERRSTGEPIAYIMGYKEFWSLELKVTPDALIPRPETELLVQIILEKFHSQSHKVIADLGTGSGAIAIALASENPTWKIDAVDNNAAALSIAQYNAKKLHLKNIFFYQSDWFKELPSTLYDAIVSNPPYIGEKDPHLDKNVLAFEPTNALLSGVDGLSALKEIILNASRYLKPGGLLALEHSHTQGEIVRYLMKLNGYHDITSYLDLSGIERTTLGSFLGIER